MNNRFAASNDLEVPLELPVRHAVQPLPPFPVASRREVVDELVAELQARLARHVPELAPLVVDDLQIAMSSAN